MATPKRQRLKRSSVTRGHRRLTSTLTSANKENLKHVSQRLFKEFNDSITSLADETGFPRSIVARATFKGGQQPKKSRSINSKNAWRSIRMKEINLGELIF